MAKMFPDIDPATITNEGERLLYIGLKNQLPYEFLCFHSYPWLRPDRDQVYREGEADFLILHQELGLLVLESKSGAVDYQAPMWKRRRLRGGWEVIKDPFIQAQKSMHSLKDLIRERTDGDVRAEDFVYGYAAAFPTDRYAGTVPNHSEPRIIISQSDMGDLAPKIEAAYALWTRKKTPMENKKWSNLVNALLPSFRLFRPVAVDLHADYEQIKELTDGQVAFFQSLYGARRVSVQGVAGSGKTLLALDRARAFAREKKRTLLVCYNKQLAEWWREQFINSELDRACLEHLDIFHFHSLARQLAAKAEIAFQVPGEPAEAQAFWREEVPAIVEQAALVLMDDPNFQYDAIVLDEGQDFHPAWWDCLNYCLLKGENDGVFYAFSDPDQSLWDWAGEQPSVVFSTPFHLKKNCRNTRAIARSSSSLAKISAEVLERSPLGLKPKISRPPTIEAGKGVLLQSVRDLLGNHGLRPKDIVLIGTKNHQSGSLAHVEEIDGVPLTSTASPWRAGQAILVTTSRSFKGLEADAVIIYDIGELGDRFHLTDLYVACTRARAYLHLIVHNSQLAQWIEQAIEHGWQQASGTFQP